MASIFRTSKNSTHKSKCFSLGKPEAESETSFEDELSLKNLFVDEMNIIESINRGSFIVTGRKGTGKSAIKSYITLNSYPIEKYVRSMELYPEIIKNDVLKQEIPDVRLRINIMCRWCIITAIIKLILETEEGRGIPEIRNLEKLRTKYFDLFNLENMVRFSAISKYTMSVNLLKGVLGGQVSKEVVRDDSKPQPFYHFLDPLYAVVGKILSMEIFKDYDFKLLVDNLDISYDLYNTDDCETLITLIRTARDFNNNPLIRTHAQVIIFLRDDVKRCLEGMASDSSKIFGSYELPLNWYEGKDIAETKLKLRKFVNRRIALNFEAINAAYYEADPWQSYVAENLIEDHQRGIFRNILDYTFFRPRDLINLFLPLSGADYTLPLKRNDIKTLLKQYSDRVYGELKDELKTKYPEKDKNLVLDFIYKISQKDSNYSDGIPYSVKKKLLPDGLSDSVIRDLFDYDVLGLIDNNGDKHFHCRGSQPTIPLEQCKFTMTRIMKLYFDLSLTIRL